MKSKYTFITKLFLLCLLASFVTITSCAGPVSDTDPKYSDDKYYESDSIDGGSVEIGEYALSVQTIEEIDLTPEPGQLTASLWRDQDNFDFWLGLMHAQTNDEGNFGVFESGLNSLLSQHSINTTTMFEVLVNSTNGVAQGVNVSIADNIAPLSKAVTNNNGKAYLFIPSDTKLPLTITVADPLSKTATIKIIDHTYANDNGLIVVDGIRLNNQITIDLACQANTNDILDILLMVDTTGSMVDEINYLKSELADVINKVSSETNATIRLALIFYRDLSDQYIYRKYDFTTNIISQLDILHQQSAAGGGDTPEAVEKAFEAALTLNWSEQSTKLLLHVADAPPHSLTDDLNSYYSSILKMSELGIRIIPIACSGVTSWTEYLFRTSALLTGGSYVFLTDDSGIGNSHIVPKTGATVVEYLNKLLIRVIIGYYTGVEPPAEPWQAEIIDELVNDLGTYILITFDTQGGSRLSTYILKKGNSLPTIKAPTKDGYIFDGWKLDGQPFDTTTKIYESITLVAIWREAS